MWWTDVYNSTLTIICYNGVAGRGVAWRGVRPNFMPTTATICALLSILCASSVVHHSFHQKLHRLLPVLRNPTSPAFSLSCSNVCPFTHIRTYTHAPKSPPPYAIKMPTVLNARIRQCSAPHLAFLRPIRTPPVWPHARFPASTAFVVLVQ